MKTWRQHTVVSALIAATALVMVTAGPALADKNRKQLQAGCDAGRLGDCVQLGILWAEGDRGEQSHEKAVALFDKACAGDEAMGCYEAARHHEGGLGVAKSMDQAIKRYKTSCDGGYLDACKVLARVYVDGRGGARIDHARARFVLTKACQLGDGPSCYELGLMWQDGKGGELSLTKARGLFEAGCDVQDARSCLQGATFLLEGIGGPRDKDKGLTYRSRACTYGGDRFCDDGNKKRTTTGGREVNAGPCEAGDDSASCVITLLQHYTPSAGTAALEKSMDFFRGKCDKGDANGCYKIGQVLQANAPDKARVFYEKACKAGSDPACVNLAFLFANGRGGAEDLDQARLYLVAACEGGDAIACLNKGIFLFTGLGTASDDVQARADFTQACEAGEPIGCYNAGVMMTLGMGGPVDAAKAKPLIAQACSYGVEEACKASKK